MLCGIDCAVGKEVVIPMRVQIGELLGRFPRKFPL